MQMGHFFVVILIALLHFTLFEGIKGHGMMLDPPGRSSRWRYDSSAPVNYNDNENFCGGFMVHWNRNGGKCGLCGDNYNDDVPRANEMGGKYGGTGSIVETYENMHTAKFGVQITTNHLGYIYFELCNLDEFHKESEDCFIKYRLKFADGSDKYYIGRTKGWIEVIVVLPNGLSCKHCVLRWTYHTENNWNSCGDGTSALGCGPQETFKSCADVSIKAPQARLNFVNIS